MLKYRFVSDGLHEHDVMGDFVVECLCKLNKGLLLGKFCSN